MASSTIHRTSSSNGNARVTPRARARARSRSCQGCVLTSRQTSPPSPSRRSSKRKSARLRRGA
jgi:hypothetical protein